MLLAFPIYCAIMQVINTSWLPSTSRSGVGRCWTQGTILSGRLAISTATLRVRTVRWPVGSCPTLCTTSCDVGQMHTIHYALNVSMP
jgi:hypothetical protein